MSRITGLILLPLLTRRLTDSELGVFGLLTSALLLLQFGSGLGLDSAATRWYYESSVQGLRGDVLDADRRRTLSSWVWTTMAVSALLCTVGVLFAQRIAQAFFDGLPSEVRAVQMASLCVPTLAMINVLQHWYRMARRPIPALVIAFGVAASTMALTIIFVGVQRMGAAGVFGAQAAVGGVVMVGGLRQMWPVIGAPSFDSERLRAMLRYALPLLPGVASTLLLGLLTRVLIRAFSNVGEVGDFQVVSMLATVGVLFTAALQQAWEPFALSVTDREAARPLYRTALTGYVAIAGLLTAGLAGGFPFALPILGSGYKDLSLAAVVLCASVLANGAVPILATGPSIVGSGRPALEAVVSGAFVNIAFCVVLVPRYGQLGACWASLFGSLVLATVCWLRSERLWRIGFSGTRSVASVVAALAASATCLAIGMRDGEMLPRIAAVVLILAVSAAGTGFVLIRDDRERALGVV